MKKLILAALAPFALVACTAGTPTVPNIPVAPVEICDRTKWDENAGIAIETGYKAWRLAIEAALDAGWLKGEFAARVAAADRTAYGFTVATQNAYKACNATGYIAAARDAQAALAAAVALLRTKGQ